MSLEIFHAVGELESFSEATTREGTVNGIVFIDKRARIFKTGVHRGKPYDEKYLDDLVSHFSVPTADDDWSVPVQLDHDMSADKTRGNIRSLDRVGKQLWGWLRFVGNKAVDAVKSGQYRKLSPAIDYARRRLVEVSVTPDPHFDDTTLFQKQPEEDPQMSNPPTNNGGQQSDALTTIDVQAFRQMQEQFGAQAQALRDQAEALREKEKRLVAAEEALVVANTQSEQFRAMMRKSTLDSKIETYRVQAKILPPMVEPLEKLLESFSDAQLEQWDAYMATQPALVDLSVRGHVEVTRPGTEQSAEEFKSSVKSLLDEYGPSMGQKQETK